MLEALSMARGIWLRRNDLVFSNKFSNPMVVVSQARDMTANFHLVAAQPSLDASPSIRLQSLWEKPPVGWLKTNWDAALSKEWKKAAFGVVVRNAEGGVVAASVTVVRFVTDPTSAEALGAWHALSLCRRRGFNHVLREGNSSEVVSAINNTLPCLSSYGQVIEDTYPFLSARGSTCGGPACQEGG